MNKAEKLKIEEYIERAHAATTLYESYTFRFVKRANIELYKILAHVYKLYLDISADELSDEIFSGMRNTLKKQHKLKLQINSSNASIVVRFATLSCTKTTSVYSRVLETAYAAGVEWEQLADYITQRGGIDKVRKAAVGVAEREAAKRGCIAAREELSLTLEAAQLGVVQLDAGVGTVITSDVQFFHLLCTRDYATGELKVVASAYPSPTLEADALHHYQLACSAAARSDKPGFKEYCADDGLNDDKVLLWMRANNIKDAAAARLLMSQLSKVANEARVGVLAEAA